MAIVSAMMNHIGIPSSFSKEESLESRQEMMRVHFDVKTLCPTGISIYSREEFSLPTARTFLRICGMDEGVIEVLNIKAKQIFSQSGVIERTQKQLSIVRSEAVKDELIQFWKWLGSPGPLLSKLQIVVPTSPQSSLVYPCYFAMCVEKARQLRQEEYMPWSEERFLEKSSVSLSHFEEPWAKEEFLISLDDIERIHMFWFQRGFQEMADLLQRHLSEQLHGTVPVRVRLVTREELQGRVALPEPCGYDCRIGFFELTIGEGTKFLEFAPRYVPFQFLTSVA